MSKRLIDILGKLGPFFALIIIIIFFRNRAGEVFFSPRNISNIIQQTSVIAIGAVGMTFIIVSAGIDLSAGSLIAFSGVCSAMAVVATGNIYVGILVAVSVGCLCGILNGVVITKGKLPPFIVTLGMLEILRGSAYQITGGLPVDTNIPQAFTNISNSVFTIPIGGTELIIPYLFLILIPVAIIGGFILKYTVFGVQVYAVGSNEQTAKLCGVNVDRVKIMVYALGGFLVGLAGLLQASRLRSGQPSTAIGLELDIIAAVVVGGGSLMGGEGTIIGSVIGAFIIRILRNGCVLMDISPYVQRIIIGIIIILAVYVDQMRRMSKEERNEMFRRIFIVLIYPYNMIFKRLSKPAK